MLGRRGRWQAVRAISRPRSWCSGSSRAPYASSVASTPARAGPGWCSPPAELPDAVARLACQHLAHTPAAYHLYPHYLISTFPVIFGVQALALSDLVRCGTARPKTSHNRSHRRPRGVWSGTRRSRSPSIGSWTISAAQPATTVSYIGDKAQLANVLQARGLRVGKTRNRLLVSGELDAPPDAAQVVTVRDSFHDARPLECTGELRFLRCAQHMPSAAVMKPYAFHTPSMAETRSSSVRGGRRCAQARSGRARSRGGPLGRGHRRRGPCAKTNRVEPAAVGVDAKRALRPGLDERFEVFLSRMRMAFDASRLQRSEPAAAEGTITVAHGCSTPPKRRCRADRTSR